MTRTVTTAAAPVLTLTAFHHHLDDSAIAGYSFEAELPTIVDAKEVAALFPKSYQIRACGLTYADRHVTGWLHHRSNLSANGVNGASNETAVKRYAAIVKKCAALGVVVEYAATYGNSYATREDFEAALTR